MHIPARQIRAVYDEHTVRVYQAYSDAIADSALANGTFLSPPFKMTRMTWITPSFLLMQNRFGCHRKDDGQKRILAIDILREGFEWLLCSSFPSRYGSAAANEPVRPLTAEQKKTPVRIHWVPERDVELRLLPYRSIHIGLSGNAVERYVHTWIRDITEVTQTAAEIEALVRDGEIEAAADRLPLERVYPIPPELRAKLWMVYSLRTVKKGAVKKRRIAAEADDPEKPYAHLLPIAQALVRRGNRLAEGSLFHNTQGGWRCDLCDPIDFEFVEENYELPASITLQRDEDFIFCRRSWIVIQGGWGD